MNKEKKYLVYAIADDAFHVMKIPASYDDMTIHRAIAQYENNPERSGRRYKARVSVGSFNFRTISMDVGGPTEAKVEASVEGLKFEKRSVVHARYRKELGQAAKAFQNIGKGGSSIKKDPVDQVWDSIFKPRL